MFQLYFETSISLDVNKLVKKIISDLFSLDNYTFLNELDFSI